MSFSGSGLDNKSQLRLQSSKVNTFSSIWKQYPLPVRKPPGTSCSGLQAQEVLHSQLSQAVAEPHWVHIPTTSLPFSTHFLSQAILSFTTPLEWGVFPLPGRISPVPPGCAQAGTGRAAEGLPRETSPSCSRRHFTSQHSSTAGSSAQGFGRLCPSTAVPGRDERRDLWPTSGIRARFPPLAPKCVITVHADAGCDVGTLPSREALGPWRWRAQQQLQEIASNVADLAPPQIFIFWVELLLLPGKGSHLGPKCVSARRPLRVPMLPYTCEVLLCTALPPRIHGKGVVQLPLQAFL